MKVTRPYKPGARPAANWQPAKQMLAPRSSSICHQRPLMVAAMSMIGHVSHVTGVKVAETPTEGHLSSVFFSFYYFISSWSFCGRSLTGIVT